MLNFSVLALGAEFFGSTRFACYAVAGNIGVFTCTVGNNLLHHGNDLFACFLRNNLTFDLGRSLVNGVAVLIDH